MKRPPVRPARLIPLLLAALLLVPLTWCFVKADRVPVFARKPSTPPDGRASRTEAAFALPAAQERRPGERPSSDSPPHDLAMPVEGFDPDLLKSTFTQDRGGVRSHGAVDIPAPRGTPVLAAGDGAVRKLFTSERGGLTVYQFDPEERYCYYYAHLDAYALSLHEGQLLRKGDVIGTVGSTGNARKDAPHLHFAVTRLDPEKKWWGGTPIDPFPLLVR